MLVKHGGWPDWRSGLVTGMLLMGCAGARSQGVESRTVRVAVLSLFHPQRLDVRSGEFFATVTRLPEGGLDVVLGDGTRRELTVLTLGSGVFTLHVQGIRTSLTRTYNGALSIRSRGGELQPVVTMETETAVASVVAAESPAGAPGEFLKAQAVAARSFLLGNLHPRAEADTCDTTHCQLLREAPAAESAAADATRATTHLVLTWKPGAGSAPQLVAARWTASCAGRTVAGHPASPTDYPFFPVDCAFCRAHPDRWAVPAATAVPASERAREDWNRAHPERQIRSLQILGGEGRGSGHGMGLCQRGGAGLAAQGAGYREILSHYYPNTTLVRLP